MKKASILFLLFIPFLLISSAIADEVNYFYDDAGRLVKVLKGTERLFYQYDEVGNLISISTESSTPGTSPPVLQGINPDIFLIGTTQNVTITGQNLLTTSSITSGNPNITIKNIAAIDTKIQATISIASSASLGQANITVTTSYGSANITISLHEAIIIPVALSLFSASTATLKVSLNPPATRNVKISIKNKTVDIISTQNSVTVPAGGQTDLTVKALKDGTGTIQIGSAEATVLVIGGDGVINANPVSVSIGAVPDGSVLSSNPVSVAWPASVDSLVSMPVSVEWPTVSAGTAVSRQISAEWPTVSAAIVVSVPVCVKIENN